MILRFFLGLCCFLSFSFPTYAQDDYPLGPDSQLTPGSLCSSGSVHRYPQHILYCQRDVASSTKRMIISLYDRERGYVIGQMDRSSFKIDHYIPLCMGGSNKTDNLWPQHQSVFVKTDPIEQRLCEMMAAGRMSQSEAVRKIRLVKNDLSQADAMLAELRRQIGH